MAFDLHNTIVKLRQELQELRKQRGHIERRMSNVNIALRSLAREIENQEEREGLLREVNAARRKPAGLTQAISETLRQTHESLSPNEVREWLEREGFDLSEYSQPLATISVTLRRLEKRGCVKAAREGRKPIYKWIGD
jgi:ABC-type transporter Mla subunit MlaD